MKNGLFLSILMTAVFATQVSAVPIQSTGGETDPQSSYGQSFPMNVPAVTEFSIQGDSSGWTVSPESTLNTPDNGIPSTFSAPLTLLVINELSIPLVPEPGSLLLLGSGLAVLMFSKKRLRLKR